MAAWPTITDGVTLLAKSVFDGIKAYVDGLTTLTFSNTGFKIEDTDASHTLTIAPGSDLSANRTLTVTTGDAARTLTISGNATISQDTTSSGTPTFAGATTTGNTTLASGSGTAVTIGGGATASTLKLLEPSGSGSNFTAFKAQAQAGDVTYTLPAADGSSGQYLSTNGSGTLSWGTAVTTSPLDVMEGRLTLTSATPVTTADVTAATTLYWALYGGNRITLYTGSAWVTLTTAQLSIAVPATTSTMYDVFLDYNSGTPQLAVLAWTNDTTRATALTTQDGVYVKTGATTQRYVGSFRTTGVSGQTEDSAAKRYVWNYYNRKSRPMHVFDTTDSWTYTTATWRQARASTANQLDFVIGVSEDRVQVSVLGAAYSTNAGVGVAIGIGLDSTSANDASSSRGLFNTPATNYTVTSTAFWRGFPGVGRHTLVWLEWSAATGTTTWLGDDGGSLVQTGIQGEIEG
ncbi:MAG: hypothetical protein VW362_08350 [Candidatus Nanopelagicales bacterium]